MRSIALEERSWGEHLVRSTYLRMIDHLVSARFSTVKPQRYKPILYSKANHDGLFISSDLWIGNLFSKFLKHNMFRPSGPDHMLIRTVKFCLFSLSLLFQESESQCRTKRQNTTNHKMKVYKIVNLLPNFLKKGPPLRGKFPLLLHPELHLAENPPLLPFPNARPPNSRGCRQAAPCSRRWCW